MRPRFSHIVRIASALRWMFGVSFARFGIERSSANSARISRSWFARQAREFFATVAGSALRGLLSIKRNTGRANLILECWPIHMKPKGCTARIVPDHSTFRKRNDSRVTLSSSRNAVSFSSARTTGQIKATPIGVLNLHRPAPSISKSNQFQRLSLNSF